MMNFADLAPFPSDHPAPFTDQLPLPVAAYLARHPSLLSSRYPNDVRAGRLLLAPPR